jgi:hypothetical protein
MASIEIVDDNKSQIIVLNSKYGKIQKKLEHFEKASFLYQAKKWRQSERFCINITDKLYKTISEKFDFVFDDISTIRVQVTNFIQPFNDIVIDISNIRSQVNNITQPFNDMVLDVSTIRSQLNNFILKFDTISFDLSEMKKQLNNGNQFFVSADSFEKFKNQTNKTLATLNNKINICIVLFLNFFLILIAIFFK